MDMTAVCRRHMIFFASMHSVKSSIWRKLPAKPGSLGYAKKIVMTNLKDQFLLDPDVVYLNHGSFGACPKPIFEKKKMLAEYIGCAHQDFFFLQNPTTAVNQIVKSLDLNQGDEILTTDHEYGAMDKTFCFYAAKKGIVYRRQRISMPLLSKDQFISEFWKGYNEKTKAIFISHITSTTALVFPVKEICERAKTLGLITIVDGAHRPGHLPLHLSEIQADFYTGTLHKWLLSPKGCSFLYVEKKFQDVIEPLIISWGYETESPTKSRFLEENEMQGTRDISAYLTVPAIMKFFQDNNLSEKQAICREVILEQYPVFCELLNTKPVCPLSPEFLGQMCSIPIRPSDPLRLKEILYQDYQIEIPVMQRGNDTYLRISYQVYNSISDLQYLKEALKKIAAHGHLNG
jgi:isopenicillin-N epimerase